MKNKIITPSKLKPGDEIRVIAPSRSLSIISYSVRENAAKRLEASGYKVTFGKNVEECDQFKSSSIKSRVEDLHEAFLDTNVKAIFTAIGGFNSNQLLDSLDYELIKNNPKILVGFSDVTALCNAILTKSGLITYYGPHFSTWGMVKGFEYTQSYFSFALESVHAYKILPSDTWSDDFWYLNQEKRIFHKNLGGKVWNEGRAKGKIIGGNLSTLILLAGTEYWPGLYNSVLCIEDDGETTAENFERCLQAITSQKDFGGVKALLIGRFQKNSGMNNEFLEEIIASKKSLAEIPIISDLDFGHTTPMTVLPIGGTAEVFIDKGKYDIQIVKH